jgi:hypothetical protein
VPVTEAEKRARVRRVRSASKRLGQVEAALQDALARLPALAREVGAIRAEIDKAVGEPAATEKEATS